jgi:hypothetical protein
MMTIDVSVIPQTISADDLWKGGADRYDYSCLPAEMRSQAMLAQGTVVEGLSSAVRRVVEAGKALSWAKAELPQGEYLPWVQQACGLKPQHASRLIKAAEWVNVAHVQHLDGLTDTATLFLLSADTTTDEVREWFMERAAAGDVPTRAEVAERKRTAGRPRQPQPAEAMALSILRKGELDRIREALVLAESASAVTAAEVMDEQRLRDLGKLRFIPGAAADFHRMKDGRWIRLPHAGDVDVTAEPPAPVAHEAQQSLLVMESPSSAAADVVSLGDAAKRIGVKRLTLTAQLAPSRNPNGITRSGFLITRESWGMVRLTPVAEPA